MQHCQTLNKIMVKVIQYMEHLEVLKSTEKKRDKKKTDKKKRENKMDRSQTKSSKSYK